MRPNRNPAPGLPFCKIKPVDPAFRSVSTPRQQKDLLVVGPVYRESAPRSVRARVLVGNWGSNCATIRPESAALGRVGRHLVPCADRRGTRLQVARGRTLLEVA
jgi:hypothetical protein